MALAATAWLHGSAGATPPDQAVASRGRAVYERACATCHGAQGRGDGPTAAALGITPRNFALGNFRFRTTASGTLPTDADLLRTIAYGVPGTEMPGWADVLPAEDLRAVSEYVKAFSPRFAAEPTGDVLPFPPELPDTPAVRARGREIYVKMQCAACHGDGGRGDGPSMPGLRDEEGRPLPASDLTVRVYKGGPKLSDVARSILTGLDGAAMPSYAAALTPEECAALTRYVVSLQRAPTFLRWLAETVR